MKAYFPPDVLTRWTPSSLLRTNTDGLLSAIVCHIRCLAHLGSPENPVGNLGKRNTSVSFFTKCIRSMEKVIFTVFCLFTGGKMHPGCIPCGCTAQMYPLPDASFLDAPLDASQMHPSMNTTTNRGCHPCLCTHLDAPRLPGDALPHQRMHSPPPPEDRWSTCGPI